jgi:hypothetical protein
MSARCFAQVSCSSRVFMVRGVLTLSLACAGLVKDEVQGDQEGDLHGEDCHAGRDGDVAPLHGPPFSDPWSGVRSARRKFCAAAEGPAASQSRQAGAATDPRSSRSERDRRHSVSTRGRV